MEKLKSLVPENLKQMVGSTTADDLPSSSSFLLRLFQQSQLFFQVIGDLTMDPENALCGKKKDAALELKRQGNQCFLNGDYANALVYYSKALLVAPMNAVDMDKNLVATLYVNRASVLHAKVKWAKEGDCNTSFFHRVASSRKNENHIGSLLPEWGIAWSPISPREDKELVAPPWRKLERLCLAVIGTRPWSG
ncbi:N-lysine methyltransferase SMYD2 isoform X3 [Cucumis melo var. makuwa]|uniref:N-lysine methyltransferase SMYD2 isoform X3 n=1 Tax=Cucumis melo var. makuwa TaxID=1194695 RepID=A0A5D3DB38_CUCMM|nr:N-lysine methyltransferase SMYD2 isoform X3 [Cucumis melo var. makuwa]